VNFHGFCIKPTCFTQLSASFYDRFLLAASECASKLGGLNVIITFLTAPHGAAISHHPETKMRKPTCYCAKGKATP